MTFEFFKDKIMSEITDYPDTWRLGQKIYNHVDKKYGGLSDFVRDFDDADCFYDDSKIDVFLRRVYDYLNVKDAVDPDTIDDVELAQIYEDVSVKSRYQYIKDEKAKEMWKFLKYYVRVDPYGNASIPAFRVMDALSMINQKNIDYCG
jgi:hypothetical protein